MRATGERFEPGSLNSVGLLGMEAALQLLLSVGMEIVESRVLYLTDMLIAGLQQRGCIVTTPIHDPRRRSGIVCFRHASIDSAVLAEELQKAGVIVSVRGNVVRVSPHFYNTESELEQLLAVLPA